MTTDDLFARPLHAFEATADARLRAGLAGLVSEPTLEGARRALLSGIALLLDDLPRWTDGAELDAPQRAALLRLRERQIGQASRNPGAPSP